MTKRPMAAWVESERERKGWKVAELSRRLIEMGYPAEVPTIRVWESPRGRDPHPDTIAALERLFGSPAPRTNDPADLSDLVAAIRELVAEMRLARAQQPDVGFAVGQAVVATLRAAGIGVSSEEPSPSDALPLGQ